MNRFSLFCSYALLLGCHLTAQAAPTDPWTQAVSGDRQITHALNRLAFGPRPGDIEMVRKIGLQKWIDTQMAPQNVDDRVLEAKVAGFDTLKMAPDRLLLALEGDQAGVFKEIRKLSQGKRKEMTMGTEEGVAMPAQDAQIKAILENANAKERQKYKTYKESGLKFGTSVRAIGELSADKLARAIDSNRQFQEVLSDFWGNHFNLDIKKGPVRALKVVDNREVIRPHVYGSFRELLGASAQSPAMLVYLDNARSTKEINLPGGKKRGGLNENYARELMELHTLGVDGGYSQKDVQEVARCLTGWSIQMKTGRFIFRERMHDNGAKEVLGVKIAAGGGQSDGEKVLDILANHPSTAKFIARKLCVRFAGDMPPISLVNRVAGAFAASKGDLKTVYRALFSSPEFWSEGAYRTKIKSPFEFVVSSVRALGGTYNAPDPKTPWGQMRLLAMGGTSLQRGGGGERQMRRSTASEIAKMGQPLWSCQAPTGYTENSSAWVSSSALVSRLNFALALTGNEITDVSLPPAAGQPATLDQATLQLVSGDLSAPTRATLQKEAPVDAAKLRALILGAPEFQRR